MAGANLYADLKAALTDFKSFLDANLSTIKPAISALKSIVPQVGEVITKLIDLMGKLKTEISGLNVNAIPGLDKVAGFTASAKTLLTTAESLLPAEKSAIDDVLGAMNVVGSLPSLESVKKEILDLIDAIVGDLNGLNA
jgi:phage-related protein